MGLPAKFRAFRIRNDGLPDGSTGYRSGIEDLSLDDINPGNVVVKVDYSSVNYKDALAGTGRGKIVRRFPLVGGIDVAGHVVASTDAAFREGDPVLVTGSGLGETRDGGYAAYARLESQWVIPLPDGLSLRESMVIGTAGFTAALALLRMADNRQKPEFGPLAVTGATGGVGSLAIDIFSNAGYEVHAISGKDTERDYLLSLGASKVLGREALDEQGALASVRFGAGLDNAGGPMLASLLAQTAPWGNVVSVGLAASPRLDATVMPFILRGVSLLGVTASGTPRELRDEVWQRLSSDWKPRHLDEIRTREVSIHDLPEVFDAMLAGGSRGRTLVKL